nr:DUF4810 domain-containing protein [Enterobacillus tribolii]
MKSLRNASLLLAAALLGGCVNTPKPMYNWDSYQESVYQYYKVGDTDTERQITALKESIEKSRAKNLLVPPGLHAHLAMLYINTGRPELAMAEFNAEKTAFPESAGFIDFLTSKDKEKFK